MNARIPRTRMMTAIFNRCLCLPEKKVVVCVSVCFRKNVNGGTQPPFEMNMIILYKMPDEIIKIPERDNHGFEKNNIGEK